MFPLGSRSAVVRTLCTLVERTVTVTGVGSGDDGERVVVAVGEGDAAAS
jgi:hypothetical protein